VSGSFTDIARDQVVIDGDRFPPSGTDEFCLVSFPPVIETDETLGDGQLNRSRNPSRAFVLTMTCGPNSEAHRLGGTKFAAQMAALDSGVGFEGFDMEFALPNGDLCAGVEVMIEQAPNMRSGQKARDYTWIFSGKATVREYGRSIPVGGGMA
jgi:hypothetical protein